MSPPPQTPYYIYTYTHTYMYSTALSGFKLVYISWLISTDTSLLYKSFVFFAEFKCFSLDLTVLFSGCMFGEWTSALVSSLCTAVWTVGYGPCDTVQMSSAVLFLFCCIKIKLNIYLTCFRGKLYHYNYSYCFIAQPYLKVYHASHTIGSAILTTYALCLCLLINYFLFFFYWSLELSVCCQQSWFRYFHY